MDEKIKRRRVKLQGFIESSERYVALLKKELDELDKMPKPEPGTAFQGMVREWLAERLELDEKDFRRDALKYPWEDLASFWPEYVKPLRTFFNSILDLATDATQTEFCDCFGRIQALKEPTL